MKQIIESIGISNFLIYLLVINIVGFVYMGIDKWKAKRNAWRIPEDTLFAITALGGGIGTIAGMYTFRHKTRKPKFFIGIPVILILQVVAIVFILTK